MTTFLMPFCAAHSAIGTVACGRVKLERTMKGEASVIVDGRGGHDDAGTLAWVASGAVAERERRQAEPGERPPTLSLTISSCASRFVTSATPVSSLTMSSIFLPATVSPFCCM